MADTIEAFVARLKAEAVGEAEKARLERRAEAEAEAERVLRAARDEAAQIVASAEADAKRTIARTRTELSLAARDALGQLRSALRSSISSVYERRAAAVLEDPAFVERLLHTVLEHYLESERLGERTFEVDLPAPMRAALVPWALRELEEKLRPAGVSFALEGQLAEAGFTYRVDGATVEVTVDAVLEVLSPLVSEEVAALLAEAAKEAG